MHKRKAGLVSFSLPSQAGLDESVIVAYADKVKYLDFFLLFFIQLINTVQTVNDYFKKQN